MAPLASSRRSATSRSWRATGAHASGTRSVFEWREVEDASAPGGLGCLTGPPAGQVSGLTGKLAQVSSSVLLCFIFCLFSFYLFGHCFKFKQDSKPVPTPLKYFYVARWTFPKHIKHFRGI